MTWVILSTALAKSGCVFDPDDQVHFLGLSALRWAQKLQMARDAKKYEEADRIRDVAISCGATVRLGKTNTFVTDGNLDGLPMPKWPSFNGYSEWVEPNHVNGRHVLDKCIYPWITLKFRGWPLPSESGKSRDPHCCRAETYLPFCQIPFGAASHSQDIGKCRIYELKVANWRDHPNLEQAKAEGWPIFMWTFSGQAGLEASTDGWWYISQEKKLKEAQMAKAISAEIDRLRTAESPFNFYTAQRKICDVSKWRYTGR